MTQLYKINLKLSQNQKKDLSSAYQVRETIVLRVTKDSLSGNDTLCLPSNVVKRTVNWKKGMDIKLAKTNIRKQVGGSLLTTNLSLGRALQQQQQQQQQQHKLYYQIKVNLIYNIIY